MSWTWLTGRMSEEAVKRHHARWYKDIASHRAGGAGAVARPVGARAYKSEDEEDPKEN